MNWLMHYELRKELEDIVGEKWVSDDPVDLYTLVIDTWWPIRMMQKENLELPRPDFAVFPGTTEEVAAIIRLAVVYDVPIIPRGGGASDTGGSIVYTRGVMLDLRRMNRLIALDETSQIVTVESGMMMSDLEQLLNVRGYTTNHLPASMYCSTVGGFVATRGSGVLSSKFGKMEDLVLTLKVVLPDGSTMKTWPVPRTSAGPDFNQLFAGSEGVLGVITEVSVQIFHLPEKRKFAAYAFTSLEDAMENGRLIMTNGLQPAVMRVYDENDTKRMVAPVLGEVGKYEGLLVLGFEGIERIVDATVEIAEKICVEHGGKALGEELGEKWWDHRYDFYYPPHTLESSQHMYAVTDTIARYDTAYELYRDLKHSLEEEFAEYELEFVAHFSHWYEWGMSIYPDFIIQKVPDDPYAANRVFTDVWKSAVEAMCRHDGVINEHHGMGMKLGRFYRDKQRDQYELLKHIKSAVDPRNIMSPGKLGLEVKT